jgi:hypothetical protein
MSAGRGGARFCLRAVLALSTLIALFWLRPGSLAQRSQRCCGSVGAYSRGK